jgi:reverse gyrase
MIKEIADSIDEGEFKPRHTIEIYCPTCGQDVNEKELAQNHCDNCLTKLDNPEQHVAIVVANLSAGGQTL